MRLYARGRSYDLSLPAWSQEGEDYDVLAYIKLEVENRLREDSTCGIYQFFPQENDGDLWQRENWITETKEQMMNEIHSLMTAFSWLEDNIRRHHPYLLSERLDDFEDDWYQAVTVDDEDLSHEQAMESIVISRIGDFLIDSSSHTLSAMEDNRVALLFAISTNTVRNEGPVVLPEFMIPLVWPQPTQ